jgi:hypothetical protein
MTAAKEARLLTGGNLKRLNSLDESQPVSCQLSVILRSRVEGLLLAPGFVSCQLSHVI